MWHNLPPARGMTLLKRASAIASVLLFAGCGRSHAVIVSSKNFTEAILLGEIAAQQIERKLHLPVERRLGLGGTLLAHEALIDGQIDLYAEYTGTASLAILKQKLNTDPAAVYLGVKQAYSKRFHLVWLPPLGFNDTFAMVVKTGAARRLKRPDLSVATVRTWKLGVGYEFLTRPDGLQRLDSVYGLKWDSAPQTMDLGLLYQALDRNQVSMAAGNSTDGTLTDHRFTQLRDDKHAFPPYNACYVVRQQALDSDRGLGPALTMLSNHISDETMRELNRRVDILHRPVVEVARDFLSTQP